MQFSLLFLLISLMSVSVTLQGVIRNDENNGNVKTLNYQSSVKEIVKDLIAAWSSPLVYLKNRGYLSAPEIGFDMLLKDDKLGQRKTRSNEEETPNDLSHLFRTLFSSSDSNVSDKIKSKLGVPWDMTALKNSVRNEAFKYYEKFYDKRNQQASNSQGDGETDIDRQVAQLYPTVVFTPNKEHADEEEKKVIEEVASHKEPKLINGIAKLLSSRAKPMPVQQLKEQKFSLFWFYFVFSFRLNLTSPSKPDASSGQLGPAHANLWQLVNQIINRAIN